MFFFVFPVELANGFHFLSHSAMHTRQLLEPRPANRRESSRPGISNLYMPAVVKALTADLAEEKKSHKKTRRDAESQVHITRLGLSPTFSSVPCHFLDCSLASSGGTSRSGA